MVGDVTQLDGAVALDGALDTGDHGDRPARHGEPLGVERDGMEAGAHGENQVPAGSEPGLAAALPEGFRSAERSEWATIDAWSQRPSAALSTSSGWPNGSATRAAVNITHSPPGRISGP